jgi:hypothetical protein
MPQSLAQRRTQARIRGIAPYHPARAKMLNMQSVNDTLDQVMTELRKFSKHSEELAQAIELCDQAKDLICQHSEKLINNPSGTVDIYKALKAPRDQVTTDFHRQGGFGNGREVFEQRRGEANHKEQQRVEREIEKKNDKELLAETGKVNCRDEDGQFC